MLVPAIVVFDLGGTWFRSAVFRPPLNLTHVSKVKAISFRLYPHLSTSELQDKLVEYVTTEADRLLIHQRLADGVASISMGAALNEHTGRILNASTLWGADHPEFDLLSRLREKRPSYCWRIINDVTAALLTYLDANSRRIGRVGLITISTGIALRLYDQNAACVPLDEIHGLQGEIGHLPISFEMGGTPLTAQCDCGGLNHLNSFCSGRGIERLLAEIRSYFDDHAGNSVLLNGNHSLRSEHPMKCLAKAVEARDSLAVEFLEQVTRPVADMLRMTFTIDPWIERLIVTGGVVHALGSSYFDTLIQQMERVGLYQITNRDRGFFARKLVLGRPDDTSCLAGAGLALTTERIQT